MNAGFEFGLDTFGDVMSDVGGHRNVDDLDPRSAARVGHSTGDSVVDPYVACFITSRHMSSRHAGSPHLRPFRLAALAACLVAVPACSAGSTGAAGTSTTTTNFVSTTSTSTIIASTETAAPQSTVAATSPTTAAPATVAPTTTTASGACTAGSSVVPKSAVSRQIVDVDGDGRPDTVWIGTETSGSVMVGVVTAAGGGIERSFDSASPVTRSILAFHLNDESPPIFLADDGRSVLLWAFVNCALVDVHNIQGNPYKFSLGFTNIGTGVGCANVGGTTQLVGLDAKPDNDGTILWSSTVVTVRDDQARNGAITTGVYTSPSDDSNIALLDDVTCDGLTIANDGLTVGD